MCVFKKIEYAYDTRMILENILTFGLSNLRIMWLSAIDGNSDRSVKLSIASLEQFTWVLSLRPSLLSDELQ